MHRQRLQHLLAAAFVGACTLPASAEIVEIAFGADRKFTHRFELAPGRFAEACGHLSAGSAVRWHYSAGEALAFNVHYHEGKAVRYPVRHDALAGADGTLNVLVDQSYCWMWTNRTSRPATVELLLAR